MARLLRYLGILLLTLAALLALVFFYPPILIAPVESYLSGFLGREFRISDSIELSVGADHTEIVVGGLEIVNPEWSRYPYLLKISDLTVTLDSKHLLSGSVFVTNLVVEGVEIGLERLDPDTASWSLPVNNESSNESAAGPGFPFHINSVELLDLQIRYADFVLSKPLIINIQSLRDVNPANDFFDFELKALVNEIPLDATGSIAPSLISGKEIEFKLDLILRRLSFHGRGSIADLNNIATLDSSWQVEIPDIADLLQTMGYSRFTDGDTKLVVETRYIDGKNQITATGNIGQFSLDTTALVSDFNEFKHVNLDLDLSGGSLEFLHEIAGVPCLPIGEFSVDVHLTKSGNRIDLPELRLKTDIMDLSLTGVIENIDLLDSANYQLNASLPELSALQCFTDLPLLISTPAELSIDFSPDRSERDRLVGQISLLNTDITVTANSFDYLDSDGAMLNMIVKSDDIAPILLQMGFDAPDGLPLSLETNFNVTEANVRIIDLEGKFERVNFTADGQLELSPLSSNLNVNLHGDSLRILSRIIDLSFLKDHRWTIDADLAMSESLIQTSNLVMTLGQLALEAEIDIENPSAERRTRVKALIQSPDIQHTIELPDVWPDKSLKLNFDLLESVKGTVSTVVLQNFEIEIGQTKANISLTDLNLNDLATMYTITAASDDLVDWSAFTPGYTLPTQPVEARISGFYDEKGLAIYEFAFGTSNTDDFNFEVKGDYSLTQMGGVLNIEGKGQQLSSIGSSELFAIPGDPFAVSARFEQGGDSLSVNRIKLKILERELDGEITFKAGEPDDLLIQFNGKNLDLSVIDLPDKEEAQSEKHRLIPDLPVTGLELGTMNVDIEVNLDSVRYRDVMLHNLLVDISLVEARLSIDNFKAEFDQGTLIIKGELAPSANGVALNARVEMKNVHSTVFTTNTDPDSAPRYSGKLDFKSEGSSTRELISHLDGSLTIEGSAGTTGRLLDRIGGDFLDQLLSKVNPWSKGSDQTVVNCSAAVGTIDQGLFRFEPGLVVQTEELSIFSNGEIDLNSEIINLSFSIQPRKGIGISAASVVNNYFKVGGTLANPRLVVAPVGAAVSGGIAVATGGASIVAVGVWNRMFSDKNPCRQVLKQAKSN